MMRAVLALRVALLACASCSRVEEQASQPRALTQEDCLTGEEGGKVGICHATGSETNPYTHIRVSTRACLSAHIQHEGDFRSDDESCGVSPADAGVPPSPDARPPDAPLPGDAQLPSDAALPPPDAPRPPDATVPPDAPLPPDAQLLSDAPLPPPDAPRPPDATVSPDACIPTCGSRVCGTVVSCGITVQCGACAPDEMCTGGGQCVCGTDEICADLGRECGPWSHDVCEETVNCGPCQEPGQLCTFDGVCRPVEGGDACQYCLEAVGGRTCCCSSGQELFCSADDTCPEGYSPCTGP